MRDNIKKLISVFKDAELYMVGGCVRDFYLGLEPHDIDFSTNLTPTQVKTLLKDNDIFFTNVGEEYGTIVAHIDHEPFEITTYRKDSKESDGRRPDYVMFADNITEDLSRRDFTMNAMAMDPTTMEIIDPFNGRADIDNKIIRFVGDANERIEEDALRIVRAIRFSIKYNFEIAEPDAIIAHAKDLYKVSHERKTDELRKIFTTGKPITDTFLKFHDVLFEIIPELAPEYKCTQINKYHRHDVFEHSLNVVDFVESDRFEIKLAALLHDIGKPSTKEVYEDGSEHFSGHPAVSAKIAESALRNDLRLTSEEFDFVIKLIEVHDTNFFTSDRQLRRTLIKYDEDFLRNLLILQDADRADHVFPPDMTEAKRKAWFTPRDIIEEMFERVHASQNTFSLKDLAIGGKDLIVLGLKPSPKFSEILNTLLEQVAVGDLENDRDILIAEAQKLV